MRLFDCRSLDKLKKSAIDVMNYRGASRSTFIKCGWKQHIYIVKICFYHLTPGVTTGDQGGDAEIKILEIFRKELIEANVTPCILEMLDSSACTDAAQLCKRQHQCIALALRGAKNVGEEIDLVMCKYNSMVRAGLAENRCSFLMLEMCDITLEQFLRRKQNYSPIIVEIIRAVMFQIVYTFYAITQLYPGFHHYDLHTQNVMLLFQQSYQFDLQRPQYMKFYVDGRTAYVPYFGVVAKIIDFGYSSLPERGVNSFAANDRRIMHARTPNDLLFLLHHVYYAVQNNTTNDAIVAMLEQIEPTRAYVEWYADYLNKVKDEISSYDKMATSAAFAQYFASVPHNAQIWADYDGLTK